MLRVKLKNIIIVITVTSSFAIYTLQRNAISYIPRTSRWRLAKQYIWPIGWSLSGLAGCHPWNPCYWLSLVTSHWKVNMIIKGKEEGKKIFFIEHKKFSVQATKNPYCHATKSAHCQCISCSEKGCSQKYHVGWIEIMIPFFSSVFKVYSLSGVHIIRKNQKQNAPSY